MPSSELRVLRRLALNRLGLGSSRALHHRVGATLDRHNPVQSRSELRDVHRQQLSFFGSVVSQKSFGPSGEWAFQASVLGCDRALSGHIFFDPSGRAVYIADGNQIVGRGVGHWAVDLDANVAAVDLHVFQYAAAAATIPEKPHRFFGVWPLDTGSSHAPGRALHGDWFLSADSTLSQSPRLVGGFEAAPSNDELLPVSLMNDQPSENAPRMSTAKRDAGLAALRQHPNSKRSPVAVEDPRLAPYTVGNVSEVQYIPNWIEREQEEEFLRMTDADMHCWDRMNGRSSQEWGAGDRCGCGRGLTRMPLPDWQQKMADALHDLGIFDGALYPMNSVRINGYVPGQGIYPHCDGPVYYPKVAILSLGSPCIFNFYPRSGTEDCMQWDRSNDVPGGHRNGDKPLVSVFLEPRSLLVFGKDAFWHHRHGIDAVSSDLVTPAVCNLDSSSRKCGDVVPRTRRISLTMRHLLPRCACQG